MRDPSLPELAAILDDNHELAPAKSAKSAGNAATSITRQPAASASTSATRRGAA